MRNGERSVLVLVLVLVFVLVFVGLAVARVLLKISLLRVCIIWPSWMWGVSQRGEDWGMNYRDQHD